MGQAHQEWIVIARLGRAHGVRGELRAWPFDDDSTTLMEVERVRLLPEEGAAGREVRLRACRVGNRCLLVRFEGVESREAADALNGHLVAVLPEHLPDLDDDDEFYHHELIGLDVFDADGQFLGVLSEIIDTGAHDNLVVQDPRDDHEFLIPFIEGMVEVDMDQERLVISPPEGLIEATRTPIKD